jgi:hypothetical protein
MDTEGKLMNKYLKIIAIFFVIAGVVFSAGCTGNTQSTQNPAQGTPDQKTTQSPANGNMMSHHRLHMNGSGRPDWNNTSGRPHFNGSERPDWNNTSGRPHFNGSGRPYWNDSGNVTGQT